MFVVRDVFKCKPGQAKNLIEKFKKSMAMMDKDIGPSNHRILVDYVTTYWTVVLEADVEDIDQFSRGLQAWGERADVREVMSGYMGLVDNGYREIFKVA